MIVDVVPELEKQAAATRNARDRVVMREAADVLRRMRREAQDRGDNHRAFVKLAERDAARKGYEAGRIDGYAEGVFAALDPMHPDHAATVRTWHERRAALLAEPST